ncbi:tyrosine-type recombinase/integrase [Mycobacteroides abscessus]|uniref:tyrosine-type recombinase/integrase n=1 Tax=Mycobacteroides abscessus TaxID=36809 RepID=UPI0009A88684|nr:site-specific integrase [Mycobacteroides abscessus]SKP39157.1 putative integrase [Mycobacteroides abscessus subsp. abscessus]SLL09334.1 putative integrase [Mycobacteroides abscessus subsp. abscessus]
MTDPSAAQHREAGARLEDLWFYSRGKKKGEKKPRHGRGKRWRVTVIGLDGERETEAFDRKVDAETHRDAAITRLTTGSYVTEKAGLVTVSAVWEVYLSHQKDGKTKDRRVSAWRTWVSPKWGKRLIRDVTRSGVKTWIVEMTNDGAGAATIESAMEVLRGVLQVAVDDKRLVENVAKGHRLPARTKVNKGYLTHDQVWTLADEIDSRYRTLILFLAYTGLRFGEAAALSVADLSMLRKQVHVRQQVSETSTGLVWTPTKGKQDRWVTLEAHIVEPVAKQCEGKKRDDLVFTAPEGGVLRLNSWRDRTWNPAVETLTDAADDFPRVTPHDLRHTAASLAVQAGANIKALQAMLGHEDATETLNTYAELFSEDLEQVARKMEKAVEEMFKRRAATPVGSR